MSNRYSRIRNCYALVLFAIALMGLQGCAQPSMTGPLTLERQGSFFVGGRNVHSDALSVLPQYAPAGTIAVDQMYVRYQVPVNATKRPITLIHGCCLTGKTWETTPDGRMGWDEYFVRAGHPVYVIDQAWRGRSAANISVVNNTRLGKSAAAQLPPVFSASQESAWAIFRFGPEHPKLFPGMQFPLNALPEFWKQMVPDWAQTFPPAINPTVPALSELAIKLDGTILMSHSQSGIYPFQVAALNTRGIAAIVSIEPGACPAPTDDLKPYLKMPILVLWGDYVDQTPRWAPRLKLCRAFEAAVNKAGGKVQNVILNDVGLPGASHMLMQDLHSHKIADWLLGWITRNP